MKAQAGRGHEAVAPTRHDDGYKWIALSNTTLGTLFSTLDSSIVLIAMPEIFHGLKLDPLDPANSFYLLWLILGFLVVTSVLVVSFGRLGDLFGRVRMYTLGFAIYTVASLLLAIDWMEGADGATWLIAFRIVQGVGAAFLIGNSAAILTDAFPSHQRGLALGINNVVGIAGQFIGLVLGGLLAPVSWRLIFLISVPFGLFGTIWSYRRLREVSLPTRAPIDWVGNLTFAVGLLLLMIAVTYGIRPAGGHSMGWTSPIVIACLAAGSLLLAAFVFVELRVSHPMFNLALFRVRAYACGVAASFLSALARGGLMFMLIIWLQAIWLPLHGYAHGETPLWAGIYMLPLTTGILLVGPVSGYLSDRFGSRVFATAGMLGAALAFSLLIALPIDFSYPWFAAVLLLMGGSMGAFAAPNRAGVMNSLPSGDRGVGGGMNQTFQNSAQVVSIGVFFTLLIVGLAATLPSAVGPGLVAHGVPAGAASNVANLPPVSIILGSFLGYDPVLHAVPAGVLGGLTPHNAAAISDLGFFPALISGPFRTGIHAAFALAIVACIAAAAASWSRGRPTRETRPGFDT
jgi:MFS family permease